MADMFKYKGYTGAVEINLRGMCLHGKILFINDLVMYEAESLSSLKLAFQDAVNDYIDTCEKLGKKSEISCQQDS